MKRLSNKEWVAVGAAVIVIAAVFYFPSLMGLLWPITGGPIGSSNEQTTVSPDQTSQTDQTSANMQNQNNIPAGLVSTDEILGTGAAVKAGDMVTVNYVGTFQDGTKFDSSIDRGIPFTFKLGAGQVIKGWDEGLLGMKVGGKRRLVIPPDLGYGSQQYGPIPANSVLIFEVQLIKIGQ